jgi:hypothetical protein
VNDGKRTRNRKKAENRVPKNRNNPAGNPPFAGNNPARFAKSNANPTRRVHGVSNSASGRRKSAKDSPFQSEIRTTGVAPVIHDDDCPDDVLVTVDVLVSIENRLATIEGLQRELGNWLRYFVNEYAKFL